MRAIMISQVLEHVEKFEDMLTEFYKKFSEESSHEGVRLLTEYMSRHSHHLKELLGEYPTEELNHILATPLPYEPHVPGCHCFEKIDLPPDPEASDVLDAAVLLDECLMQLYRQVVDKPVDQRIKELFRELIVITERDEVQLKKIKAMNYF